MTGHHLLNAMAVGATSVNLTKGHNNMLASSVVVIRERNLGAGLDNGAVHL